MKNRNERISLEHRISMLFITVLAMYDKSTNQPQLKNEILERIFDKDIMAFL
jgi:hypothetical protein